MPVLWLHQGQQDQQGLDAGLGGLLFTVGMGAVLV